MSVEDVSDYAKVQEMLIGCVVVFLIVVTILGPEKHGPHFKKSSPLPSSIAIVDDVDGHIRAGPLQRRNSASIDPAKGIG